MIGGDVKGSVVAFNGVMENNLAIPNYLDRRRWRDLCCAHFAGSAKHGEHVTEPMLPARPLRMALSIFLIVLGLQLCWRGLS